MRGLCGFYTLFMAYMAYSAGLKENWCIFDGDGLLAGLYCFLTLKSHSRVKDSRRRRPND